MLAAVRHAGRGSELMGSARWWQAGDAAAGSEQRAAAAAAASREVQAAQHASAVQAASRADADASQAAASAGAAGGEQPPRAASRDGSRGGGAADAGGIAWRWQAVGRWAERVSSELRAQMWQVGLAQQHARRCLKLGDSQGRGRGLRWLLPAGRNTQRSRLPGTAQRTRRQGARSRPALRGRCSRELSACAAS